MYDLYCDRVTGLEYITMILTYIHNQRNSYLLCCCLVANMYPTLASSWTVARQAPLSMGFFRQEYWSGLPFPSPGDLPDSGNRTHISCTAGAFFTAEPPGKPQRSLKRLVKIRMQFFSHSNSSIS